MRPPDEQDIWDVVTRQTGSIKQLTDIVKKQSEELDVLTVAFHRQEDQIKQLKRMVYDLQEGKITLK